MLYRLFVDHCEGRNIKKQSVLKKLIPQPRKRTTTAAVHAGTPQPATSHRAPMWPKTGGGGGMLRDPKTCCTWSRCQNNQFSKLRIFQPRGWNLLKQIKRAPPQRRPMDTPRPPAHICQLRWKTYRAGLKHAVQVLYFTIAGGPTIRKSVLKNPIFYPKEGLKTGSGWIRHFSVSNGPQPVLGGARCHKTRPQTAYDGATPQQRYPTPPSTFPFRGMTHCMVSGLLRDNINR